MRPTSRNELINELSYESEERCCSSDAPSLAVSGMIMYNVAARRLMFNYNHKTRKARALNLKLILHGNVLN